MVEIQKPNGWGRTYFGDEDRPMKYSKDKDIELGKKKHSFIKEWVVKYITGVKEFRQ